MAKAPPAVFLLPGYSVFFTNCMGSQEFCKTWTTGTRNKINPTPQNTKSAFRCATCALCIIASQINKLKKIYANGTCHAGYIENKSPRHTNISQQYKIFEI